MGDSTSELSYGVMMPVEALKKLVMSLSATEVDCEVRSDSVRAISVTLRSIATAEENSTVPKNITSISGTITANSVAATALLSARNFRAEPQTNRQKKANTHNKQLTLR